MPTKGKRKKGISARPPLPLFISFPSPNSSVEDLTGDQPFFFEKPKIAATPAIRRSEVSDLAFKKLREDILNLMPQGCELRAIQVLSSGIAAADNAESLRNFLNAELEKYPTIPGKNSFYKTRISDCIEKIDDFQANKTASPGCGSVTM